MSQREEEWPRDAAQAARHFHEVWLGGGISAQAAVRNLAAMGFDDAWNLWLDACDEHAPEVGKRVQKKRNPDGSARRSRPLPAREAAMSENENEDPTTTVPKKKKGRPPKESNGNGALATVPNAVKRGRQPKEPPPPVVMDLYLPRGRTVQIALPGDVADDDMPVIREQLDAFMALRAAQRKARGA